MYTVFKLALAFLCVGLCATRQIPPNNLLRNTERDLLQLMVDTRFEQRANPEQSLACFNYYLPLFDSLNEEYKNNYAACLTTADENRSQIDASTQSKRNLIESSANSSCKALKDCTGLSGSIDYFTCFTDSGKENTEIMYEISANASETLAEVRELYRLIDNAEYRCTNASERSYVEKTYQANLDLQSCLRGDSVPPTKKPSTEAPESTTAPVQPSTEAPESTAVPNEPSSTVVESTTGPVEPNTEATESTAVESTATTEFLSSEGPKTPVNDQGYEALLPEEDLYVLKNYDLEKVRVALKKQLKNRKIK